MRPALLLLLLALLGAAVAVLAQQPEAAPGADAAAVPRGPRGGYPRPGGPLGDRMGPRPGQLGRAGEDRFQRHRDRREGDSEDREDRFFERRHANRTARLNAWLERHADLQLTPEKVQEMRDRAQKQDERMAEMRAHRMEVRAARQQQLKEENQA